VRLRGGRLGRSAVSLIAAEVVRRGGRDRRGRAAAPLPLSERIARRARRRNRPAARRAHKQKLRGLAGRPMGAEVGARFFPGRARPAFLAPLLAGAGGHHEGGERGERQHDADHTSRHDRVLGSVHDHLALAPAATTNAATADRISATRMERVRMGNTSNREGSVAVSECAAVGHDAITRPSDHTSAPRRMVPPTEGGAAASHPARPSANSAG